MLTIRAEQWEAMRKARVEEFHGKFARQIQMTHPEWCDGGEASRALEIVYEVHDRANSFGIFMAEDVERFQEFVLRAGLNFENEPQFDWATRVLRDSNVMGADKLDVLENGPR